MNGSYFVDQHILGAVYAAVVEANGHEDEARRLNAHTKLRLIMMSDAEVWELAGKVAYLPDKPSEKVFAEIREAIAEYRATADTWISDVYGAANSREATN
ncbi:MAG: hypothetical protein WC749_07080 [Dehalococcoidia bacterium]